MGLDWTAISAIAAEFLDEYAPYLSFVVGMMVLGLIGSTAVGLFRRDASGGVGGGGSAGGVGPRFSQSSGGLGDRRVRQLVRNRPEDRDEWHSTYADARNKGFSQEAALLFADGARDNRKSKERSDRAAFWGMELVRRAPRRRSYTRRG